MAALIFTSYDALFLSVMKPIFDRNVMGTATNECVDCADALDALHEPLALQSFESDEQLPPRAGWARLGKPHNEVLLLTRVSYWIWRPILQEGSDNASRNGWAILWAPLRFILAWPVVLAAMAMSLASVTNDHLHYHDVLSGGRDPYHDERDEDASDARRAAAGRAEERGTLSDNIALSAVHRQASASASLRPRYLCFVKDTSGVDGASPSYETRNVSEYLAEHGEDTDVEFVFVSYTRMQFRVATSEEIDAYNYPDVTTREANRRVAKEDRERLIKWGIEAARAAGKPAFWLDFECVRDSDGVARSTSASDDVYQICDIVRAAHSMIIAIGAPASLRVAAVAAVAAQGRRRRPSLEQPEDEEEDHTTPSQTIRYSADDETRWLREWGSRLWTLPELLLCPSEHRIKLYIVGSPHEPKALAKRNFAERAWDDAAAVKELVDHFEGSAILTPLQFIVVALRCFSKRKTDQFSPGDIAYAIMGLLPQSQRPPVIQADSGFQAFARLSMAYDSGKFLERLLCIMPPARTAPWYDTSDAWQAKLWAVDPACRILDVVDAQTVILDGAYGAAIQWDRLEALPLDTQQDQILGYNRSSDWQPLYAYRLTLFSALAVPVTFLYMLLAAVAAFYKTPISPERFLQLRYKIVYLPLLLSLSTSFLITWTKIHIVPKLRACKVARFYGIEGRVDAASVERRLFGFWHGRLKELDSFFSSGRSASSDRAADDISSRSGGPDGAEEEECSRIFTLVDTAAMTVTQFRAENPPVAVLICGQEGGKHRALLCAYDPENKTFHRETVLRMPLSVVAKMSRLNHFRFSPSPLSALRAGRVRSPEADSEPAGPVESSSSTPRPRREQRPKPKQMADGLIVVLTAMLFADPYSKVGPGWFPGWYFAAFLAAQLPVVILLSHYLSDIALSIPLLSVTLNENMGRISVSVLRGLVHGFAIPAVIALVRTLYTPRAITSRLLLFYTAGGWLAGLGPVTTLFNNKDAGKYPIEVVYMLTHLAALLFLYSWARRMRALFRPERTQEPTPRDQTRLSLVVARALRLLSILAASACASGLVPAGPRGSSFDVASALPPVLMAAILGQVLSRRPGWQVQVMLTCCLLPLIHALIPHVSRSPTISWALSLLMAPGNLVLPLLWALIATEENQLHERIAAVSASVVGICINGLVSLQLPTGRDGLASLLWPLITVFFVGLVALCYYPLSDWKYSRVWRVWTRQRRTGYSGLWYQDLLPRDEEEFPVEIR